jgi:hypothetical protein
MLCGLFCFPVTMVIREWRVRPVWAVGLLFAIVGSVAWVLYDAQPSSGARYSALGYAAILLVSAYLYFTSPDQVASTVAAGRSMLGTVRENSHWFVIGIAISAEAADSCVILSSSRNAVSISSDRTTNLFPSSRCASTIHIVRPSESTAETQPKLQPALLSLSAIISQYFTRIEAAAIGAARLIDLRPS